MKSKEEIIKILKTIFPGKYPYMYEYVADAILSEEDSNAAPHKHFSYSEYIAAGLQDKKKDAGVKLPPIHAFERAKPVESGPVNGKLNIKRDFMYVNPDNAKDKKCYGCIEASNFDGSKDPILSKGLCANVVRYDEDESLRTLLEYKIGNNETEYAKAINDICYDIFCKHLSITKTGDILDGFYNPKSKEEAKILEDVVNTLGPLVDEYCPFCVWMMFIRLAVSLYKVQEEE